MRSKLEDLPRYSSASTELPAALFNEIRLALIRLEKSIQFPIPGLQNLEIILDVETWIVIDVSLNDIPVVAWLDFEVHHRDTLHKPIKCNVYSYHQHADVIIETVLNELHKELDSRLHQK